jgi:NAD(P)-dependent dehydrogenase (short-subunit alcohol dehydrogenase family)
MAVALQADLVSEGACVDLMDAVHEELGGCDILINNASLFHKDRIPEATFEKIEKEFWPNCWAPFFLIREVASRNSGQGDVINLLDRRIETLDTACVPYLLSKKALAEITRLAALEYAPRIRVNGIAPGAILPPPGKDEAYLEEHAGKIPLGRISSPEEIASVVLHYLSQPSLTGQITFVDGGQHLLGADKV